MVAENDTMLADIEEGLAAAVASLMKNSDIDMNSAMDMLGIE